MKTYNPIEDSFRDSIGTVDDDGKRKWIHPKKVSGSWMKKRTWVAMGLLIFFFAIPWIRIGGAPLLKLDVLGREFVILGKTFWPQDFYILGLGMIVGVLFVVLFTVIYGRIFCGWICPQTIFMEHVFRRIEYWIDGDRGQQIRLKKLPWNSFEKVWKRSLKYSVFWMISFAIANTFLMVIIGTEDWEQLVVDGPAAHLGSFISLIVFTTVFFFVFSWFREQVCIMVCPYGRLQGAMLDRKSVVIAYDNVRGEKRAKFKKNEDRESQGKGDCIDCHQCVDVCPTGIDIRNGTQLECINCTACIDVCNDVMERIDRPKGLIRYASEEEIQSGVKWRFTTRAAAYTGVLVVLMTTMGFLLSERSIVDVKLLRSKSNMYTQLEDDMILNMVNFTAANKSSVDVGFELSLINSEGSAEIVPTDLDSLSSGELVSGTIMIKLPAEALQGSRTSLEFEVKINGVRSEVITFPFAGPRVSSMPSKGNLP